MKPMPRKGTETSLRSSSAISALMKPMPRKGTETCFLHQIWNDRIWMKPMPRKGTET